MKRVFSRWPSQVRPSILTEPEGKAAFPRWMRRRSQALSRAKLLTAFWAFVTVLTPAGLALVAGILLARPSADAWLFLAAGLAIMVALAYAIAIGRSLLRSKTRYEAVFERAGISMWREDWSAAAQEISSLRQQGVTDIEAHFADRPDALRDLCARVIIRDVNAFTVQEAGAPGKEAFIGSLDRLLPHTDQTFVQWLVAFARGDRFFRSEAHISMPDGSVRDTLFAAALPSDIEGFSNVIVTSLDITEYKSEQTKLQAADAEIARASRISTVGALSASIAHEVNSPLAAILANAQAALRWLRRSEPNVLDATEAVAAVIVEATRAKDVVARTRAFVGNAPICAAPFDIVVAAREAILLVEQELRKLDAAVHLGTALDHAVVHGDVIQVQQVFTNLLLNAAQAMTGQAAAREITVAFKRDGDRIRVDIADTGPGIDAQHLERVFDPFYTTKAEGMGMGLAICRNCIDAQGGHIWATVGDRGGAVMHFTLPTNDE
jgi:C4-dicarboxylate-specific signal transduction histidine kinase